MRRDAFQAIADPTRRAIILLVAMNPMTPNSIAEYFRSTRQAISRHLLVLIECGLLSKEQSGRETYYKFDVNKITEVHKWLDQLRKIQGGNFDEIAQVISSLKKKRK